MDEEITLADLDRIYVLFDDQPGAPRRLLNVLQMSVRQFSDWVRDVADYYHVRILLPAGHTGMETRARILDRMAKAGAKIHMTPRTP